MKRNLAKYIEDECGATAVEYGLIAALVSVAGIAALTQMGVSLISIFENIGTLISSSASAANGS